MAQIRNEFPYPIREIENLWIPLADGTRLAARLWLPVNAENQPVPAILEYLPYRKDDHTAYRDSLHHPYFAGHGYACLRVDLRGSGGSDGILHDEYLPQEQDDAVEVLAWLAAQPWCTGAVGMIGISWGGFNGLQVAARRPAQLQAVISICSTDDRYSDDVHYMGGCLLASEMLNWASIMLAYNAQPPDPHWAGERWRELWLARLEQSPPFVEAWLSHQRRDAFWQQGSVCEEYAAITCPVYMVGGWADAYSNAVLRTLAGLAGPRKGLIGPWAHSYLEIASPAPAIGFLQECLRWWDYWLKGLDTGIMAEPMLRVWLQESVPPQTHYPTRPGRWVAEPIWPAPTITPQLFYLNPGSLDPISQPEVELHLLGDQSCGMSAGIWCPYGVPGDMPLDQRRDDGLSLCFDSASATASQEILGFPTVTLTLAVDRPLALVAVRLCDVGPTGESLLVSWGLLNLTHRTSHAEPTPLQPGKRYTVTVQLNAIAHQLAPGHRWRVALSPTYWPHAWPSPEPVTLTVFSGSSSYLALPMRPPSAADQQLAPFAAPETAPPLALESVRPGSRQRVWSFDTAQHPVRYQLVERADEGTQRYPNGLLLTEMRTDTFSIGAGDPLSACITAERTICLERGEWSIRVATASSLTAAASTFLVTNTVQAFEGETPVFHKNYTRQIERDLV